TSSDATFQDDVIGSTIPVLVDFTATWCPPCVMIKPVLERIAADEVGRVRVVTLDVDENPVVTARYEVLGMPTLALFVGGEVVTRFMGAKPRTAILNIIEPYLAKADRSIAS
ncbi:MAG: thioredoxin domain-containing protein, partial [Nakamurella sp.]